MRTLGTAASPERYARLTIKERILREISRRLETKDWTFATVQWEKIVRFPIPDDYRGLGAILSVLDADEEFGVTTTGYQCTCEILLDYVLTPGAGETASSVLELVKGDLIERLAGHHALREGGDNGTGEELSCTFLPVRYQPMVPDNHEGPARAMLTMNLVFRHETHRPFNRRP